MKIDERPRDFSYIHYKDTYPLQLKGNMKRKSQQHSDHINCSHSLNRFKTQNGDKLNDSLNDSYQYIKCLPIDLSTPKNKQSIKTFHKQKYYNIAGVIYLMAKSDDGHHSERKHLTERSLCSSIKKEEERKQKKHYWQMNLESSVIHPEKPKVITESMAKKLSNDLHSKRQVKEGMQNLTPKVVNRIDLFKQGIKLGLEHQKKQKMSRAKKRSVMGQSWVQQLKCKKKMSHFNWNRSTIVIC